MSLRSRVRLIVLLGVIGSIFTPWLAQAQSGRAPVRDLRVEGDRFLVDRGNGFQAEFLTFISYFDALRATHLEQDLDYIRDVGFHGIRIFANWQDFRPNDCPGRYSDTLLDANGNVRGDEPAGATGPLAALLRVLARARERGLIVDVSFDHGTVAGLGIDNYVRGLRRTATLLRPHRHILFDLQNERDLVGRGTFLPAADIGRLRDAIKADPDPLVGDPARILVASTTESTGQSGTVAFVQETRLDAIAFHDSRISGWEQAVTTVVQELRAAGKPVYLQEPMPWQGDHADMRCGVAQGDSNPEHFRTALRKAKEAGAAAWLLHVQHGFILDSPFREKLEPALRALLEDDSLGARLTDSADNVPWGVETSLAVTFGAAGTGAGTVTSQDGLIQCTGTGPSCRATYRPSTVVTLTAQPGDGSVFDGWSGAPGCSLEPTCRVTMSTSTSVQATFMLEPTDTVEYVHFDAVGSVRLITGEQRQVIGRFDFLPFGEEWTGTSVGESPRKFTGTERDTESGLDYFGARYHSAQLGRFTSVDPLTTWGDNLLDPQRWNRYVYARDNPLRYVDPDGQGIIPKVIKFIAKGGDIAATVQGVVDDYNTLTNSDASTFDRAVALASIASEVLPISGRDVKEGFDLASAVVRKTRGVRQLPFNDADRVTEINRTLDLIERDKGYPFGRDNSVFKNHPSASTGKIALPIREYGYYREYTVVTPGHPTRGLRRIVTGRGGEFYYTDNHYEPGSFIRLDPTKRPEY